jgi:hypothetical protein
MWRETNSLTIVITHYHPIMCVMLSFQNGQEMWQHPWWNWNPSWSDPGWTWQGNYFIVLLLVCVLPEPPLCRQVGGWLNWIDDWIPPLRFHTLFWRPWRRCRNGDGLLWCLNLISDPDGDVCIFRLERVSPSLSETEDLACSKVCALWILLASPCQARLSSVDMLGRETASRLKP